MTVDEQQRRALSLQGADNVRDLGGLPTADGARTRAGVLYRASTLQELTDDDVRVLTEEVGLRLVVDLREPEEAEREGRGPVAAHVPGYVNLTIRSGDPLPADVVPDIVDIDLAAHYVGYLEASVEELVMIVRLLADSRHHPAVFHCAAGKDRTGVVAALVLDAVGVLPEAIVADYAATAANAEAIFARLRRLPSYRYLDDLPPTVRTAEAETMQRFLDELHDEHGGAARWLRGNGVGKDELAALRAALVEPAG